MEDLTILNIFLAFFFKVKRTSIQLSSVQFSCSVVSMKRN